MKKLVLAGILLMMVATIFVFGKSTPNTSTTVSATKQQELIDLAKQRFADKKATGVDMTNGPCLGTIAAGWVVDVAHNPRQAVDDKSENQCPEVLSGTISHFIELDPTGNLIRVQ